MNLLFLENIRSLLNVGAMFRAADGAGVKKLCLAGLTPTPPRPEIAKTALWAEKALEWEWRNEPIAWLGELKKDGYTLIALEKNSASESIFAVSKNIPEPWCLIVGHETDGVSSQALELSEKVIHLPMRGIKESLNVATAATTAMYVLMERE